MPLREALAKPFASNSKVDFRLAGKHFDGLDLLSCYRNKSPGDFGVDGRDLVALIACPLNVEIIVQNFGRTGCP